MKYVNDGGTMIVFNDLSYNYSYGRDGSRTNVTAEENQQKQDRQSCLSVVFVLQRLRFFKVVVVVVVVAEKW